MLPGQEPVSEVFGYSDLVVQDIQRLDNDPKELIVRLLGYYAR
jgi:hypothetical protein